jgi:hypothetical protein
MDGVNSRIVRGIAFAEVEPGGDCAPGAPTTTGGMGGSRATWHSIAQATASRAQVYIATIVRRDQGTDHVR